MCWQVIRRTTTFALSTSTSDQGIASGLLCLMLTGESLIICAKSESCCISQSQTTLCVHTMSVLSQHVPVALFFSYSSCVFPINCIFFFPNESLEIVVYIGCDQLGLLNVGYMLCKYCSHPCKMLNQGQASCIIKPTLCLGMVLTIWLVLGGRCWRTCMNTTCQCIVSSKSQVTWCGSVLAQFTGCRLL